MKTNHYSKTAKNISNISALAGRANFCGNINDEQHKELKEKVKCAQFDNLFAAMAAYCMK